MPKNNHEVKAKDQYIKTLKPKPKKKEKAVREKRPGETNWLCNNPNWPEIPAEELEKMLQQNPDLPFMRSWPYVKEKAEAEGSSSSTTEGVSPAEETSPATEGGSSSSSNTEGGPPTGSTNH